MRFFLIGAFLFLSPVYGEVTRLENQALIFQAGGAIEAMQLKENAFRKMPESSRSESDKIKNRSDQDNVLGYIERKNLNISSAVYFRNKNVHFNPTSEEGIWYMHEPMQMPPPAVVRGNVRLPIYMILDYTWSMASPNMMPGWAHAFDAIGVKNGASSLTGKYENSWTKGAKPHFLMSASAVIADPEKFIIGIGDGSFHYYPSNLTHNPASAMPDFFGRC